MRNACTWSAVTSANSVSSPTRRQNVSSTLSVLLKSSPIDFRNATYWRAISFSVITHLPDRSPRRDVGWQDPPWHRCGLCPVSGVRDGPQFPSSITPLPVTARRKHAAKDVFCDAGGKPPEPKNDR